MTYDNGVVAGGEPVEAFECDLEEGSDHDDGEDEHADGFEAAAAHRVGVGVLARDEFRRRPDNSCGEEVKGCVDKAGKD